jgi:hypothetical protein
MSSEPFEKASEMTRLLISDLQAMLNSKSNGENKVASRKSLEPTVRLRKDVEELKEVKENDPEVQFIIDKLGDIFGG